MSQRNIADKGHRNGFTGFTLVEMLGVVAIIVIPAAILFPVFSRARENARRSFFQSNLKQIGLEIIWKLCGASRITMSGFPSS